MTRSSPISRGGFWSGTSSNSSGDLLLPYRRISHRGGRILDACRLITDGWPPHREWAGQLPDELRQERERRLNDRQERRGGLLAVVSVRVYEHDEEPQVSFPPEALLGVEAEAPVTVRGGGPGPDAARPVALSLRRSGRRPQGASAWRPSFSRCVKKSSGCWNIHRGRVSPPGTSATAASHVILFGELLARRAGTGPESRLAHRTWAGRPARGDRREMSPSLPLGEGAHQAVPTS